MIRNTWRIAVLVIPAAFLLAFHLAFLLSLPKAMAHALQTAMVIDGEPYPYDKWLCFAARPML